VIQPARFGVEAFVFPTLELRPIDLVHHVVQVVGPAQRLVAPGDESGFFVSQRGRRSVRFGQRGPFTHRIREGIQDVALSLGMKQRLGLVLAVQIYEKGSDPTQHGDRRRTAVDPGPGSPVAGNLAANDQAVILGIEPGSIEAAP